MLYVINISIVTHLKTDVVGNYTSIVRYLNIGFL